MEIKRIRTTKRKIGDNPSGSKLTPLFGA